MSYNVHELIKIDLNVFLMSLIVKTDRIIMWLLKTTGIVFFSLKNFFSKISSCLGRLSMIIEASGSSTNVDATSYFFKHIIDLIACV